MYSSRSNYFGISQVFLIISILWINVQSFLLYIFELLFCTPSTFGPNGNLLMELFDDLIGKYQYALFAMFFHSKILNSCK